MDWVILSFWIFFLIINLLNGKIILEGEVLKVFKVYYLNIFFIKNYEREKIFRKIRNTIMFRNSNYRKYGNPLFNLVTKQTKYFRTWKNFGYYKSSNFRWSHFRRKFYTSKISFIFKNIKNSYFFIDNFSYYYVF